MLCPVNSDRVFGPRVDIRCRAFDFTLAFEDAVLCSLAPSVFLLLLFPYLRILYHSPTVIDSYTPIKYKLVSVQSQVPHVEVSNEGHFQTALNFLFGVQLAFLVVQTTSPELHTTASLASSILILSASAGAPLLSYTEHERSVRPSSLLILYLFTSAVTAAPKLRTLWLLRSSNTAAALWTLVVSTTLIACFIESSTKTKHLKTSHQDVTKEETSNFWGRGFYVWTLPLFRRGYSTILRLADIPPVDSSLSGSFAYEKLRSTWERLEHPSQASWKWHSRFLRKGQLTMFRAAVLAFLWPFCSAIIPRLCLTVFTFSQTFLITATIEYVETPTTPQTRHYGQALIGAYVLMYLGYAVGTARQ